MGQILKELEVKLQSTESGVEKYEARCLEAQKTIESLKKGIESMFLKIECPGQAEVIKDLVNEVTVNEANMLQFLGIIEQQCNLIIVNPPKLEDYSSEDEDEDEDEETRPLTREELKAKTLNRMHRRVNRDGARGAAGKKTQRATRGR